MKVVSGNKILYRVSVLGFKHTCALYQRREGKEMGREEGKEERDGEERRGGSKEGE